MARITKCAACGANYDEPHHANCPYSKYGVTMHRAEDVPDDAAPEIREIRKSDHPHGSIESVFAYRAPRPDQRTRHESIREGYILLAKLVETNVPNCADRRVALECLRHSMMLSNAAIDLDGEGLES